ncbi:hypothetical protein COV20_03775 [Candidatus Woesearchaeota archaeon CG10_big_fil_rev_8_21_14_0_10_45_16]|nr:MAG: hypothetical protein COV20_03775 [Candidatus Woesearchaeota archaeon CG10_big_fil_rev_8_21_14_0_10_45_16]
MKILFICENYIPHYGGAEVVFKNLAEGFVKRGHTVSLITHQLQDTKRREKLNGVDVYRIPSFHSRYVFSFSAILKSIMLARNADVIQTTTFNGAFPAWLASKITGKPVILTVHEVWVGKWQAVTGFSKWKSWLHDSLERLIYLLPFDHYACVSEATRKDLMKLKIPARKVSRIYNGFDYDFWNQQRFKAEKAASIRKKLNLNDDYVFFSWGRPGPSKGFEYAVKAMPLIMKEKPDAVLLLMLGSIDKYQEGFQRLRKLIKELKLSDRVKIIPSVPYEQLGDHIKMADCVIVPSVAEGFGYTTLEANAMGKPVIISDAGSLPEVVSGKHLIFRKKDSGDLALKALKMMQKRYNDTPKKRFTWEESISSYLQVYKRL